MKIEEIIVVEGRDDTQAVKKAVDCETIETHGFGMPDDMWKSLDTAYRNKGLVILTDPDHAGDGIRKRIKERYPDCKEAFLPRSKAMKGKDVGVENASPEDIREALSKVRERKEETGESQKVTGKAFDEAGLSGAPESRKRREMLADTLGVAYGNAKALLERINAFGITEEEFNEAVRAIDNKADKE